MSDLFDQRYYDGREGLGRREGDEGADLGGGVVGGG